MNHSCDVPTNTTNEDMHVLTPSSSWHGGVPYRSLDQMVDFSGHQIPDSEMHGAAQRCLSDSDWLYNQTTSSGEAHASLALVGLECTRWIPPVIAPSADQAIHEHSMNDGSVNVCSDYRYSAPSDYSMNATAFVNTGYTPGISRVTEDRTETNPGESRTHIAALTHEAVTTTTPIRCWLHGCNGRSFAHLSNYRRHCREKSRLHVKHFCPLCGKYFTRRTAWKIHTDQDRCRITGHDANGVPFERKRNLLELGV